MDLYLHQQEALNQTQHHNKVAYYLDMGLGKTFIGSEKLNDFNTLYNLVICQKSKIQDWYDHFKTNYSTYTILIYNKSLTSLPIKSIIIINYDLIARRPELIKLLNQNLSPITLLLDESQYIKNSSANRTKAVLKIIADNVILLSGTPVGGKYEELWTQCKLLGWDIPKYKFYDRYIITRQIDVVGFKLDIVVGYKNVEELKENLRKHGAVFQKTEDVIKLPDQIEIQKYVPITSEYKKFKKTNIININNIDLVGENMLTQLMYLRQLASLYNQHKIQAIKDLLESTNDRLVIFYNWRDECTLLKQICKNLDKPISYINGDGTDLQEYNNEHNSVTLVQYQAGSTGVNLQKSNKIIYYSPPLSADMWMQSAKRIHRIGQKNTCFYYHLITKNSIEEKIYKVLQQRKDYTLDLFEGGI